MQGNTTKNFLDLKAPVQFKLEDDKAVVDAGETRWDFEQNQLVFKGSGFCFATEGRGAWCWLHD